jgi:hypothetical protein
MRQLGFLALGFALLVPGASPGDGIYFAGPSRTLTVSDSSATSFAFELDVGVTEGNERCEEGDVSCLSIAGTATHVASGVFTYVEEGELIFRSRGGRIEIVGVMGRLGSGSRNAHQLQFVAGTYERPQPQMNGATEPPEDVFFQTPSGNISCAMLSDGGGFVRCDMQQLEQTYRQRPQDCDLDWGAVFGIAADGQVGELVCHGDTLLGASPMRLEYGRSVAAFGILCTSERSGLTCRNAAGHGFTLSKARQQLF